MQVATWNVNSLKVRLNHVTDWLAQTGCDIVGLQELKLDNENNQQLVAHFAEIGYNYVYNGQKTYNGVALLSKLPLCDVTRTCPEHIFKGQRDPRLGPHKDDQTKQPITTNTPICVPATTQGANCAK